MASITMDLDDFICLMEHFTRSHCGDAMSLRNAALIKSGRPVMRVRGGGVYPSGYDPNTVPQFAGDPVGALVANVKAAIEAAE
ncbi:hypothetical protein [Streptomyces sp. OP7]|uniref:hypothetical protein n=1 Tax=Streptomyces sp. OP7 TaxID=3142462 RepID=UPI0032E86EA8